MITAERVCTCGFDEREAKRQHRWNRATSENGELWPPLPNHHFENCGSLLDYPLHPLAATPACVKCGQSNIQTTFHKAHWHYEPHRHDYWRVDLYKWSCLLTHAYRPVEHLDRTCSTCGWKWLEKTADVA